MLVISFQQWEEVQKILANHKDLNEHILRFNSKLIREETATDVRKLIEKINVHELFKASPGAVTFFCWTKLNLVLYVQGYRIVSVQNASFKVK